MLALKTGMDPTVQVAMVTVIGTFMLAVLGMIAEGMRRNHNALRAVQVDTAASREQVQNSHSTNLRDDIDKIMLALTQVADTQRQHGYELGHLRRDGQQERTERVAADARMDSHIAIVAATAAANMAAVMGPMAPVPPGPPPSLP